MDLTHHLADQVDSVGKEPTPRELVQRAAELRPMLRAQQDAAEARGHYDEDVHRALVDADLYRVLTPRRYGGLEMDLSAYARVVIEISRGDPSTGWCYSLGHNHNLTTASHWSAQAQDEVFNNPAGYFRSSHSVAGAIEATPVDGGFRLTGASPYQSGVPYSTYATVNAVVKDSVGPDGLPEIIAAIVPRGEFQVLDDWSGDGTLGLRGSGSNTVVVDDVFVPEHRTSLFDWVHHDYDKPSEGNELHGNPMYLGPVAGFFHLALVSPMVGAAKAAVDEYENIINTRTMLFPPFDLRRDDPHHQADLGMAMTMTDAAEAIVIRACDQYMEYCADLVERGITFTMEKDVRLYGIIQRAGELASEAVSLLYRSAGSSAARAGHPIQRYFRDVSMYRGHISAQYQWTAMKIAQVHFGLRKSPF
ncbi:acyl-CoA dehydrogenase family protein [Saccharopolyspora sp. 5N708]|uniref:acyl-CoA dehydrogenase family protein n=1 Tax=Saccharopolyspora sp. 5N708 TaxID=3457424 RepID=UPI003FD117A7